MDTTLIADDLWVRDTMTCLGLVKLWRPADPAVRTLAGMVAYARDEYDGGICDQWVIVDPDGELLASSANKWVIPVYRVWAPLYGTVDDIAESVNFDDLRQWAMNNVDTQYWIVSDTGQLFVMFDGIDCTYVDPDYEYKLY
jgi:hypothetical protein